MGLNDKQLEAVRYDGDQLLVLAGAGSGKTRCVTQKVRNLLDSGVSLSNIVAITFTNKAADEMVERISEFRQISRENSNICTFHSFCYRLIRANVGYFGLDRVRICNDKQAQTLLKDAIEVEGADAPNLEGKIERWKNRLIYPDTPQMRGHRLNGVYRRYQELLLQSNMFDFSDLISQAVLMLKGSAEIREKYQNEYKYLIVDEFQDVNNAQFELVKTLHVPGKNKLMIVGDDAQAIYGFRDSNPSFIMNFQNTFPTGRIVRLEQNYRSSETILMAANSVIGNNSTGLKKNLWTENLKGEKITVVNPVGEQSEGQYIARVVREGHSRGKRYREHCVLYRANSQARVVQDELQVAGIPCHVVHGVSFQDRREVQDILSYLRLIDNPYDYVALRRCAKVPKKGIGAVAIGKVIEDSKANGENLISAMKSSSNDKVAGFGEFLGSLSGLRNCASALIDRLCAGIKYESYLEKLEGKVSVKERLQSLKKIQEISRVKAENESVTALLDRFSLDSQVDEEDADMVRLCTVHSAKGLEWDTVFLIGMNKGLFPHNVLDDCDNLEEARRLFYVAITRAKTKLHISHTQFNRDSKSEPSSFLKELPKEVVEVTGGCNDIPNTWQSQEREGYSSEFDYF